MKKIITIIITLTFLTGFVLPVLAQTADVAALQELIKKLQAQIEELKAKIEVLKQAQIQVKETAKEIKTTLQLAQQLRVGMRNDDVGLLQELLATDPEIYPEGLVTGYYGLLTAKAVKKFQQKAGLEQVGQVGPKTLSRLNEILTEGAGNSGKVPPGLLIAPGIKEKLGGVIPQPLPGQILPPGIEKKIETTTPSTDGVSNR